MVPFWLILAIFRIQHLQPFFFFSYEQIANEDDNDSSDDDDEQSMGGDEAARSEDMAVDEPKPSKPTPDADGWTTVPSRRGRGKN
jgi:pre-rRNA-processing protein TSR2